MARTLHQAPPRPPSNSGLIYTLSAGVAPERLEQARGDAPGAPGDGDDALAGEDRVADAHQAAEGRQAGRVAARERRAGEGQAADAPERAAGKRAPGARRR